MPPQVQYINAPSYPRIINLWLRVGMIGGAVIGIGYMAIEKLIVTLFAELLIPGIGEAIMIGFIIVAMAFVGVGALLGMIIGNIHYLIAKVSYENRQKSNI